MQDNQQQPIRPIQPDQGGDFDSPALSALRDIWDAYMEGEADEADVKGVIHQIGASLEHHLDVLQDQVNKGASDVYNPVFAATCKAFMDHLGALKHMLREFEPDTESDGTFFEEGYELAQKATNNMMRSHDQTMSYIQNQTPPPIPQAEAPSGPLWMRELGTDSATGQPYLQSLSLLENILAGGGKLDRIQELIKATKANFQAQARENLQFMARLSGRSELEVTRRKAYADSGLVITRVTASLDRLSIANASQAPDAVAETLGQLRVACGELAACYHRLANMAIPKA